ncbi:MAG: ribosome recycling factor [Pseudomonadota bacterium]|nr:ribosome recycling factor [Pseudomonadota bacterium]
MSTDFEETKKDIKRRMEGALEVLKGEFQGLRTGRASTSLLENITVEAYGSNLPMNQVGNIGVPEPRLLTVQVWDKGLVSAVEKSILESGLGLNPSSDGPLVRVPIPALNEERRIELSKVANKYAEDARIAARNVRRHAMDDLKQSEKNNEFSKDEHHDYSIEIQELTDIYVGKIDELLAKKEKDIKQV